MILYQPLEYLLTEEGFNVKRTHGIKEKGKDLIAVKEGQYNLLVSVKRGRINQKRWDTEVLSSIDQMMTRSITYAGVKEELEKRILLVLNDYLEPGVAELIKEKSDFHSKIFGSEIEVWDLSKLAEKFNDKLRYFFLFESSTKGEFLRLVSSISNESYDKKQMMNFIDKYFNLDSKTFFSFRLIMSYLARYSNSVSNPYASMFFSECVLACMWKEMFLADKFECIDNFDEMHFFYINELKDWVSTISEEKNGLLDIQNGISEILTYSIRTFDVIKRLSYYIYFCMLQTFDQKEIPNQVDKLINIIKNNEAANKPLFEINCIDIGISLFILYKRNKIFDLKDWIYQILDFLVSHFSQNYHTISLKDQSQSVPDFLISSYIKDKPNIEINSNILGVLIEFIVLTQSVEIFETYKHHLSNYNMFELEGPSDESSIYQPDFISGNTIQIGINMTYDALVKTIHSLLKRKSKRYSPIINYRPYVLLLLSNIHRDRYFPQTWHNYL